MAVILLAEDDDMSRDLLSRRLTKLGYTVVTATHGQQAIDVARNKHVDLILMDLCMPGVDGLKATRMLRDHESTASIPVIALTALASATDVKRAILAGCNDYETKPVVLPRLLLKMRKALPAAIGDAEANPRPSAPA